MFKKQSLVLLSCLFIFSCKEGSDVPKEPAVPVISIPQISYETIASYPHDTSSFTEGLLLHEGQLFESTGATPDISQTRSLFGTVDLSTGKINVKAEIDKKKYFGEGIAILKDKVFQLTYKNKIGFIYNAKTFKKIGEFSIPSNEGWGMTSDGTNLIMSDGSNTLTWLDPDSLRVVKSITVTENGYAKDDLNELEYVKGFLYANIWMTPTIVKIDPADGKIVGVLDLSPLYDQAKQLYGGTMEMNGIAHDAVKDHLYITGKMWPKIYEIKLKP